MAASALYRQGAREIRRCTRDAGHAALAARKPASERRTSRRGDDGIGYGRPPAATRFRKGQSGNPRGRPRGRRSEPPYEAVLGQMVTIREDGVERRVTAAEAFLLHVTKRGLEGDGAAARVGDGGDRRGARQPVAARPARDSSPSSLTMCAPGSVNTALEPLRMARKLDRYRETARMVLEPWIVEAALARLGARRLISLSSRWSSSDAHALEGAMAGLVGSPAMNSCDAAPGV